MRNDDGFKIERSTGRVCVCGIGAQVLFVKTLAHPGDASTGATSEGTSGTEVPGPCTKGQHFRHKQ